MNDNSDKKIEEVLKGIKNISLTEAERAVMFSRIDKFVASNPRKIAQLTQSPYFSWSFFSLHAKGMAFAVVVFIVLGSTSAAAQYSLPGEILYSIKVNVNEEVRSIFTVNNVSKAKFESQRAKERLKEASVLARNGKLSETAKIEIEEKLTKHVAVVQNNINKLKSEGALNQALDLSTDLEVNLRASEGELSEISTAVAISADRSEEIISDNSHLSSLVEAVEEKIEQTSTARIDTEATISDSNNDETIKLAVETKRDAVLKFLATVDTDKDIKEKAQTEDTDTSVGIRAKGTAENTMSLMMASAPVEMTREDKIAQIKELIKQGEEFIAKKMYKEAFDSFNAAFELESSLQTKAEVTSDETKTNPEVKGEELPSIHNKVFDKKKELI